MNLDSFLFDLVIMGSFVCARIYVRGAEHPQFKPMRDPVTSSRRGFLATARRCAWRNCATRAPVCLCWPGSGPFWRWRCTSSSYYHC